MGGSKAVFFDRDGTLMKDVHYCGDPAQVKLYPGVPEALARLKKAGFRTIIVSNQSGIGRGLITEAQYRAVEEELQRQIGDGKIDASYFCPDAPGVPSSRRKPEPGMVLEAAADLDLDLAGSYLIGDKAADVECGRRAGVRTIQVQTGYGVEQRVEADFQAAGVVEAVEIVLAEEEKAGNSGLPARFDSTGSLDFPQRTVTTREEADQRSTGLPDGLRPGGDRNGPGGAT